MGASAGSSAAPENFQAEANQKPKSSEAQPPDITFEMRYAAHLIGPFFNPECERQLRSGGYREPDIERSRRLRDRPKVGRWGPRQL